MHLTATPSSGLRGAVLAAAALSLSLIGSASGAPSPNQNPFGTGISKLAKRTCSIQYPELRTAGAPDQPIPYTLSINAAQTARVEVGFTIPDDAVGPCSLMIALPNGCSMSGGAQINVYALDGPAAGALVGTTIFEEGTAATINSFACRAQMCYGLEVASTADGTGVEFLQEQGVGLSMTYDC